MDLNDELGGRLLVVYDGHCGLCNHSVRWLLRRDSHDRLRFVASQSEKIVDLLARHGFVVSDSQPGHPSNAHNINQPPVAPSTILVLSGIGTPSEQLLTRSDAIIVILRELPQPWPAIAAVLPLIPRPLRDLGYRIIARSRYRIWGRLVTCPIPTPAERAHFL